MKSVNHRLTVEDWYELNSRLGKAVETDNKLVSLVDNLLSAPVEEIYVIVDSIRILIAERDGLPCSDEVLRYEIDQASWYIGNPKQYLGSEITRYIPSNL